MVYFVHLKPHKFMGNMYTTPCWPIFLCIRENYVKTPLCNLYHVDKAIKNSISSFNVLTEWKNAAR